MIKAKTIMYGDEITAGIFEDDVRPVKNSMLIQFESTKEMAKALKDGHVDLITEWGKPVEII